MRDVKRCSFELKSLCGTRPHPCGFGKSAVEAHSLKTKTAQTDKPVENQERREFSDVAELSLTDNYTLYSV